MPYQHQDPIPPNSKPNNQYFPLLGSMTIGLVCGATEGISPILQKIKNDLDLNVFQASFLASCGVIGLFFIIPSGIILDKYGPLNGCLIGYAISIVCIITFSFLGEETFWLMCIMFLGASFGNGLSWFAALKVSIGTLPDNPGVGLAFASACMSASVGLVNVMLAVYQSLTGHNNDDQWPELFRVMGVIQTVFLIPGSLMLRTYVEEVPLPVIVSYDDLTHDEEDSDSDLDSPSRTRTRRSNADEHASLLPGGDKKVNRSTDVEGQLTTVDHHKGVHLGKIRLDDFNFWLICFSFCLGIGAGIIVLSALNQMWHSFTGGDVDDDKWPNILSALFAVCNVFVGTLFAGSLCDFLVLKHGWRRSLPTALISLFSTVVFAILSLLAFFEDEIGDTLAFQVIWMIFLSLVGSSFGATLTLYPVLLTELYGMHKFNAYWSFIETVSCIPSLAVPYLAYAVYDASENFNYVFAGFSLCFLISGILLLRIR